MFPVKIAAGIFSRNWQADAIHTEMQEAQKSKNNLENEKVSWKTHISQF